MKKSVKIIISGKFNYTQLPRFLLAQSKLLAIQGILQIVNPESANLYLTGNIDNVESFIDSIFDDNSGIERAEIDIKPMDEDKDFRGIFRVVHNTD